MDHHAGHGGHEDHGDHAAQFRDRFWLSLALTVPVVAYSEMVQEWLGFTPPQFPGSRVGGAGAGHDGVPVRRLAVPPGWPGRGPRRGSRA